MKKMGAPDFRNGGKVRSILAAAFPVCSDPACPRWRGKVPWRTSGFYLQGNWYCTPECFEAALTSYYGAIRLSFAEPDNTAHRLPLGLILLARNSLSTAQLRAALLAQQTMRRRRLGEWLVTMGVTTEQEITAALAQQWRCPVYPVDCSTELRWADMIPVPILEFFRMMPMHYVHSTRILHVAFCDGVDHSMLYRIDQMLDCRSEPCLLPCSVMEKLLEDVRQRRRAGEIVFQQVSHPAELARITRNYAVKLNASNVRIVSCGAQIWVRFQSASDAISLVFTSGALPTLHRPEVLPEMSIAR